VSERILEHELRSGTARFADDELVVRLPYTRLVLGRLKEWWPELRDPGEDDHIPAIELDRIHLDAAAVHAALDRKHSDLVEKARSAARAAGLVDQQGRVHDLEIVLRCLRLSFEEEFGGWTPTIGKNRVMQRLKGSYVIDGGGHGGPRREPGYVIDGGGVGSPGGVESGRTIALRGRSPAARVRVGVVDTKVWLHPWLAGSVVADPQDLISVVGRTEATKTSPPQHATFVSGLILRQAPDAIVELRTALDESATSDTWTVARKIADLAASSVELINLSLGCLTEDAKPPLVLSAAMDALGPQTVVVAAAGNHADKGSAETAAPSWPAALDNVIAVGASDHGGTATAFTPGAPWVDVLAPGVEVVSTCVHDADRTLFGRWSGTSFAAAAVTGAIAGQAQRHGSARAAWVCLQGDESLKRDAQGRLLVPLRHIDGWPEDNRGAGPAS
jgi:membrane-anchored mycosin MYCP